MEKNSFNQEVSVEEKNDVLVEQEISVRVIRFRNLCGIVRVCDETSCFPTYMRAREQAASSNRGYARDEASSNGAQVSG